LLARFTFSFLKLYSPHLGHACPRAIRSARLWVIDAKD
jgi:hypothetical protein